MRMYNFSFSVIPIITTPPQNATVLLGGEVIFICTAIGVPVPNIIVWSSETNISINATSTVVENLRTSILNLTNLTSSYFNQSYTCTAINNHGVTNSSAVLTQGSESST